MRRVAADLTDLLSVEHAHGGIAAVIQNAVGWFLRCPQRCAWG
jgi:hypothetical protein